MTATSGIYIDIEIQNFLNSFFIVFKQSFLFSVFFFHFFLYLSVSKLMILKYSQISHIEPTISNLMILTTESCSTVSCSRHSIHTYLFCTTNSFNHRVQLFFSPYISLRSCISNKNTLIQPITEILYNTWIPTQTSYLSQDDHARYDKINRALAARRIRKEEWRAQRNIAH